MPRNCSSTRVRMWPAAALALSAVTNLEQSSCSETEALLSAEAVFSANPCGCGEAVTDVGDGVEDGVGDDIGVVGPFSTKSCCFTRMSGMAGGRVFARTTTNPLALGRLVASGATAF